MIELGSLNGPSWYIVRTRMYPSEELYCTVVRYRIGTHYLGIAYTLILATEGYHATP